MTQPPSDWNWPGLTPEAEAEDARARKSVYFLFGGCLLTTFAAVGLFCVMYVVWPFGFPW